MSTWREIKLKDVCEQITVGHVGSMATEYKEQGIPFLRSLNINPFRLSFDNLKFIDANFHEKLKKSALKAGDLVIVRTGYPGTACVIPKSLQVSNCSDLVIVRVGKEINPYFLAAIFNSNFGKDLVLGNLVGAAQQHFNVTAAKEMKLTIPSKAQQDKIAAILSAYDDLIENNKRRITLLENMAEEIYREWFVRFRFPNYKNAEFEKGIPKGWELRPFSEVVNINPTERPDKDEKPYVGMEALSTKSMYFESNEKRSSNSGSKFRNGDTLFPRITPCLENGKRGFTMTLNEGEIAIGSTEFIVMREKVLTPEFIYLLSCFEPFRTHAEISMVGASGRQRVAEGCFSFFLVPTPPISILDEFTNIVRPMFQQVKMLSKENTLLAKTRDSLLPRLISGKLTVENLNIQFPPSMVETT